MSKKLYDEEHHYTNRATIIDHEILTLLGPTFKKYTNLGYSPRELGHIAQTAISILELEAVLGSDVEKYKKKKRENGLFYTASDGKVYDKKCYNCQVEWLDDQCSTEQERCDSCKVDGIYTKWEINQWQLENGQLLPTEEKIDEK